ncbi:hypothetical protein RD110_06520 [Rhodoferax koreense]|uniref:Peptidase S8/S53 domain-containing protein n=1 Tax=Rhodoferax koreensis TaxID=1842727 RepID=A0A1P8JT23_9BURK|nr:hypothetical protein RD110_06520 [Rhodoferax koreense]
MTDLPQLALQVERFELAMPVLAEPDRLADQIPDRLPPAVARSDLLAERVIAVIDDGFAHLHREFLAADGQSSRIRYLWDQERDTETIRNGVLTNVLSSNGQLWDESVYLQQKLRGALKAFSHGTLVASLAGGRSRPRWRMERFGRVNGGAMGGSKSPGKSASDETSGDAASDCQLILVQFPRRTVEDNSGSSLSAQTLNALSYIGSRCAADANLVINLSYGPAAGPHDGSSLLEAALDGFIEARGGSKTAVVVPAGNQYQARGHACLELAPDGGSNTLLWRVLPDDATESFVEIWAPIDAQISVQLTPPNSKADASSDWVSLKPGGLTVWADGADASYAVIAAPLNAKGNGRMALLALAPTTTRAPRRPARHGCWTIEVRNDDAKEKVSVHAWVQRDDPTLSAAGRGGRQSYFEDEFYRRFDDAGRPQLEDNTVSLVRRDGSISPIATGGKTCKAGAYRLSDEKMLSYSGGGDCLPKAAGPDLVAVAEESTNVRGILGAGTRGGSVVRGNGTSVAAPQLARRLLAVLDGSRTRDQLIQAAIKQPAMRAPGTPPPTPPRTRRQGRGELKA